MKKVGRKVDLSNIKVDEIDIWMHNNNQTTSILKCQSIIASSRGVPMQEVCNVLGITRESVRQWKKQLRKGGLTTLLEKGKVGKRSKLSEIKLNELKSAIKQSPDKYNIEGRKWTGKLVRIYVSENWKMEISTRTAYKWFSQAKL